MSKFKEGDKVIIKHQKEVGVCTVTNGHDETSMIHIGGEPVGFYVRVDSSKGKNLGYHECNVEFAPTQ